MIFTLLLQPIMVFTQIKGKETDGKSKLKETEIIVRRFRIMFVTR